MARGELQKDIVNGNKSMDVFIIGITGKIGGLLAQKLLSKGDTVHGLVRRAMNSGQTSRQEASMWKSGISPA